MSCMTHYFAVGMDKDQTGTNLTFLIVKIENYSSEKSRRRRCLDDRV